MTTYALMVDNEYCTGCHSCEVACRNELGLPQGQWGIKILELGPWRLMDGKHWEYRYVPVPTSYCNLCIDRITQDRAPACSLHCLADAIEHGSVEELSAKMIEKGRQASLFLP